MRVYRIVVDEWPTPDGKPWDRAYGPSAYGLTEGQEIPEWLEECVGRSHDWRVLTRVQHDDRTDEIALIVLPLPKRTNYLSASGVSELIANMQAFGAKARAVASKPVEWPEGVTP